MTVLEDIYAPFKPGRKTKADKAVEAGLEPLAEYIMLNNPPMAKILEKAEDFVCEAFADTESVLNGAKEIIAQKIADNQSVRTLVRTSIENGCIVSKVKRGKQESGATYSDYFDFKESVRKITPHRVMALNRAEKEGILNISAETDLSEKELIDKTESLFLQKSPIFSKSTPRIRSRIWSRARLKQRLSINSRKQQSKSRSTLSTKILSRFFLCHRSVKRR